MKKEALRQILYVIIAVTLVSFIIGAISHIAFFDGFITYATELDRNYLYMSSQNRLFPFFIPCLIFTILIALLLLSFIFIPRIKKQKTKELTFRVILCLILTISLISIILARASLNACWKGNEYETNSLPYYEANLANVLNVSLSAVILVVAIVALMYITKKEKQAVEAQTNGAETSTEPVSLKEATKERVIEVAPKKRTQK